MLGGHNRFNNIVLCNFVDLDSSRYRLFYVLLNEQQQFAVGMLECFSDIFSDFLPLYPLDFEVGSRDDLATNLLSIRPKQAVKFRIFILTKNRCVFVIFLLVIFDTTVLP